MTVYADVLTNRDERKINISAPIGAVASDDRLADFYGTAGILTVLSGRGEIVSGDDSFPMYEGGIFIIPAGCDCFINPVGRYRALLIAGRFDLLSYIKQIQHITDNELSEGRKLSELILHNKDGNEGYLDCLCYALIKYVLLNLKRTPKNTSAAIQRIIYKIESEYGSSDLSIGGLLDESGYTRDYIRSEFEAVTGMTPKKYLNTVRMKNAKAMIELCGGKMSIGEIAERCGVIDPTIFSRIYKKHFGISPSQYRESLKSADT
nr:helix-turn-helix domain-containing protein [Oscillospiraceae bacterium]